jgi:hypothetical protein
MHPALPRGERDWQSIATGIAIELVGRKLGQLPGWIMCSSASGNAPIIAHEKQPAQVTQIQKVANGHKNVQS